MPSVPVRTIADARAAHPATLEEGLQRGEVRAA